MKYGFDYWTRCEICGALIKFDNPFRANYNRICENKRCIELSTPEGKAKLLGAKDKE